MKENWHFNELMLLCIVILLAIAVVWGFDLKG